MSKEIEKAQFTKNRGLPKFFWLTTPVPYLSRSGSLIYSELAVQGFICVLCVSIYVSYLTHFWVWAKMIRQKDYVNSFIAAMFSVLDNSRN
jgi:uncharacterized membrane protein